MSKIFHLNNRAVLEVSGDDARKFIQGLVTNDITNLKTNQLIFTAMLNATGRFLYDFFVSCDSYDVNKLYLNCHKIIAEELAKKLNFFRLRSKVNIKINNQLIVLYSLDNNFLTDHQSLVYQDPRANDLGFFVYCNQQFLSSIQVNNFEQYHQFRIKNKIIEGYEDLVFEKSFIQEFNYDQLHAIDYRKGCYVGQEIIARTHFKGEIRKKIFYLSFDFKDNQNFKEYLQQLNLISFSTNQITYLNVNQHLLTINTDNLLSNNALKSEFNQSNSDVNYEIGKILSIFCNDQYFIALGQIKIFENFQLEILKNSLKIDQYKINKLTIN